MCLFLAMISSIMPAVVMDAMLLLYFLVGNAGKLNAASVMISIYMALTGKKLSCN